jgi:hypothetical protein
MLTTMYGDGNDTDDLSVLDNNALINYITCFENLHFYTFASKSLIFYKVL